MESTTLKKQDDLEEIVIMSDRILTLRVCAAIPPERENELPEKIFQKIGSNGTSAGLWHLVDYNEHPEAKPVPCEDYEGRWHYVLVC